MINIRDLYRCQYTIQILCELLYRTHLYQIFSYVKNEACNTKNQVYGMLLYAATDDGMILDHKYQMSGNQIWVKTLDLYREFKDISHDLKQIVRDHFGEQ